MIGYLPPSCAMIEPEANAGPGHVFTETATLVNNYCDELPPECAVSTEEIDKLFQKSLSLELGPDCTPIQIWANLIRISARYPINSRLLRVLTDVFTKYIICNRSVEQFFGILFTSKTLNFYSFGAVVERSTASTIISYFFPGEEFVSDWPLP